MQMKDGLTSSCPVVDHDAEPIFSNAELARHRRSGLQQVPEQHGVLRRRMKRLQALEKTGPTAVAESATALRIKGYRVVRRLGGGGMSEVFLAVREIDGLELP